MPQPLAGIASRIAAVRSRADDAARTAGRDPREVRVLLATKTQDAATVLDAVAAAAGTPGWGPVLVGENRVQELVAKAPALAPLVAAGTVEVHLIGHLQSNKVNPALATSSCVETVDSLAIATALATRCERAGRVLDVMVQVNVSGEESKSGVAPESAVALAGEVAALPGLRLVGFMTIGARSRDDAVVRAGYARLRAIRDAVVGSGAPGTAEARELSMGMTDDLEAAIAEGATIVRVGTGIFGPR
ncbi:alanine racemase domain protein [Xylanimonas cellulosilytica DSM 15894]|uniref:Pyridoxal phosphate homeostasis protein n=1 Tax=Xylanimonas cellulosilytica (strain DSM 15894 / JCM 12276 / CECT 5975 / KCTC 9989 / LMG 20990 / NBRC 107835 / XIL07) TaxID=446471 RepID=D1BVS5_XYLCX|nr:YggS family pyridoxal phosphate-dependent enzyme [Xylanimonas cellulosilytica]ACZ31394.1 alanine racemase domain protein [Xylanimonas cellulosilytica DSM 15894]